MRWLANRILPLLDYSRSADQRDPLRAALPFFTDATAAHVAQGTFQWNHYIRAIDGEMRLWVNDEEVSAGKNCNPATGLLCFESEGIAELAGCSFLKGAPSKRPVGTRATAHFPRPDNTTWRAGACASVEVIASERVDHPAAAGANSTSKVCVPFGEMVKNPPPITR